MKANHSSGTDRTETATFQSSTLTDQPIDLLRRHLLKAGATLPLLPILANLSACSAGGNGVQEIAGYQPELQPNKETLQSWLQQLHDFGPIRATGTKQCRDFEEWLAIQFEELGFSIERDQYRLTSWECDLDDCAIELTLDDGSEQELEVIAYYPFAATTVASGPVSGKLLYAGVTEPDVEKFIAATDPAELKNAIVIVDMPLADGGIRGTPQYYPGCAFPDPFQDRVTSAPRPASQGGRREMALLEDKCRGIIFCYTDVMDEAARYNYLPFSDQHRKIPALWVGKESAAYLKTIAGSANATLTCKAKLTPDARADSIVATLQGSSDEVIFLTTHTDGPNEVNDNGALGVLALATYYSKLPPEKRQRTLVCSLPTGHYAGGAIRDPDTGSGESAGTRGVMAKHPDIIERTVAQIAMEQLAALDWIEIDGEWKWSGLPAREMWLPTKDVEPPTINPLLMACTQGEDPQFSRTTIVESGYAPGEGGSLRRAEIPGIGLMGSPEYFFRADPEGVLKYLSADVFHNQVSILTKLLVLMERLPAEKLKGDIPITEQDLFGA